MFTTLLQSKKWILKINNALVVGNSNLVSFHQLIKDLHKVEYNSDKDVYEVTIDDQVIVFQPNHEYVNHNIYLTPTSSIIANDDDDTHTKTVTKAKMQVAKEMDTS